MAPSSFEYTLPAFGSGEPRVCPHCKESIQPSDTVHWFRDVLWHTKPCPTEESTAP
jgi:hypothetical protein